MNRLYNRKIGIISGLGASAGSRFYDMLIKKCQELGALKDSDFPEIVLHNISSHGMDETGICDHDAIQKDLADSVRFLNESGCDLIAIACNSVHIYHRSLQKESRANILNMIDIASESASGFRVVGVISSRTTKDYGLYRNSLFEYGAALIETTNEEQSEVDEMIDKVIQGTHSENDTNRLYDMALSMIHKGAGKVILGCTELPLLCCPPFCIDAGGKTIERVLQE